MGLGALILLAIIQGVTEFLPVSSSGHLVLIYRIFGIDNDVVFLSILLHISTLLSILWHYRRDIIKLVLHPFCPTNRKIIVTTIMTIGIVLILKSFIDSTFDGGYLSTFFMCTAIILFVSDIVSERHRKFDRIKNDICPQSDICNLKVSYMQAIAIGIGQGVACIPGISRSGTTIAIAKIVGVDRDSAKYSFLISIPIIIGSMLVEILAGGAIVKTNIAGVIVAFVICFIIGLSSIKIMDKISNSNKLTLFSYYLTIISLFLIINSLFLHWF